MRNEIANLPQPMKAYFETLLEFDVKPNYNNTDVFIGCGSLGGIMLPPLEPQEAHELSKRMREVLMPIIQEFTAMKLAQVMGIHITPEQTNFAPQAPMQQLQNEVPQAPEDGLIVPARQSNPLKRIMDRLF